MGGNKGDTRPEQSKSSPSARQTSARRRNTVQTSSIEPASPGPWPQVTPNIATSSPYLLPAYSPYLAYAPLSHHPQTIYTQPNVPYAFAVASQTPSPRTSTIPYKGNHRQARSPYIDLDVGHGQQRTDDHTNVARPVMMSSSKGAGKMNMDHSNGGSVARPPLPPTRSSFSQHSASVPSTPHPHTRRLAHSRSPSPHDLSGHSPRSAYSESHSTFPAIPSSSLGCPFETGMAFSRRRIPYSVGTEKLDKAKGSIKGRLKPHEEKKLTGAMEELYHKILPTEESEARRTGFLQKLQKLLSDEWPDSDVKVHVFGSSGNMLCTADSDVDVCITTPVKELEKVCTLAMVLARHGMEKVVCVPNAKVPIVKIWDPEFKLACDMNVNNTLALENTRMIKTYVQIDQRVRPLAMIVKHWTKRRILNDAALGATLSSYTWICMILNFLQTRNPPILPSLHERKRNRPHEAIGIDGSGSEFADNLKALKTFGQANKETLGELLFHFFRRYAHEIDYDTAVLSVRLGKLLTKQEKGWHLVQDNRLCVEEPFNTTRNLGNTADDTSFRGIHMELRRAFTLVADETDLDKCCEAYVFPPEEGKVWSRPPPKPRPVLSRSASQSGRGGRGGGASGRGSRNSSTHRQSQQQGRRASSGAALGSIMGNGLDHFQHHQVSAQPTEWLLHAQQAQNRIHENLFRHFQLLQMQENELRAIQQLQQQQALASSQHPQNGQRSASMAYSGSQPGRPPFYDGVSMTAPLRQEQFFAPYQFSSAPLSHPGTQISQSPSLGVPAPELRRTLHRSSAASGLGSASSRSHSQPAGRVPSPLITDALSSSTHVFPPMPRYHVAHDLPLNGIEQRPEEALTTTESEPSDISEEGKAAKVETPPKEYIGYMIESQPSSSTKSTREQSDFTLQPIPPFRRGPRDGRNTITHGSRPFIDKLTEELRPNSLVGHKRSASERSVLHPGPQKESISQSPLRQRRDFQAPLIVNGSSTSHAPVDENHIQPSVSASTSASDERDLDTSATASDTYSQGQSDSTLSEKHDQGFSMKQYAELQGSAGGLGIDLSYAKDVESVVPPVEGTANWNHARAVVSSATAEGSVPGTENVKLSSPGQTRSPPVSQRQRPHPMNGFVPISVQMGSTLPIDGVVDGHSQEATESAPQLSPVPEIPTPSPTANRKFDLPKPPKLQRNSTGSNGTGSTTPQQSPTSKSPLTRSSTFGRGDKVPSNSSTVNGAPREKVNGASHNDQAWQQSISKGTAKRAKINAKRDAMSNKPVGQAEKAIQIERKGG